MSCEASQVAHCDAPPGPVSSLPPEGRLTMPSLVPASPVPAGPSPGGPCSSFVPSSLCTLWFVHALSLCCVWASPGMVWSGGGSLVCSLHLKLLRAYSHVLMFVSPSVPGRPARYEPCIMDAWSFRGRWRTKPLAETAFPWLLSGFSRAASFQGLASCLADCLLPAPLPLLALHKIMQG